MNHAQCPKVPHRGRLYVYSIACLTVALLCITAVYAQEHVSPVELYHHVWAETATNIYAPDKLGDWQSWEHRYDNKIATDKDALKYAGEMLKSIHDSYTFVLDPEAVKREDTSSEGVFGGVGITFATKKSTDGGDLLLACDADGYPLVEKVTEGSPAAAVSLAAGDALVSIGNFSAQHKQLEAIVSHLRGEVGTAVQVTVRRNRQDYQVTLVRAEIKIPAVIAKMLPGQIAYIHLEDFSQQTAAAQVAEAMCSLGDTKAFILDLRDNPGGYIYQAVDVVSLFVEEGTVVIEKNRVPDNPDNPSWTTDTTSLTRTQLVETEASSSDSSQAKSKKTARHFPYLAKHRPVVILVNGDSASAAELATGAIRDNNAAFVIGTRTFGKGIGQSLLNLPNGCRLHVTSLIYMTPSGAWLGDGGNSVNQGITPDLTVNPNKKNFEFGSAEDNQLATAVTVILSLLAR